MSMSLLKLLKREKKIKEWIKQTLRIAKIDSHVTTSLRTKYDELDDVRENIIEALEKELEKRTDYSEL